MMNKVNRLSFTFTFSFFGFEWVKGKLGTLKPMTLGTGHKNWVYGQARQ